MNDLRQRGLLVMAWPRDLRERVVEAAQSGDTLASAARQFRVAGTINGA